MVIGDHVMVKDTSSYWRKYHHDMTYIIKKIYNVVDLNGKVVTTANIISQYEIDNNFGTESIPLSELVSVKDK